jgi:hypothetical protein
MTTDRDTTRIVRSWLSSDEHESADLVLDNVLALLDTIPQRRSPWPAWRFANVNITAKLASAVAAVAVVAVLGVLFFPRSSGVTSPGSTPTIGPSVPPSLATSPTPAPSRSPVARDFPPDGPLAAGRHTIVRSGVALSFELPDAGWNAVQEVAIDRGDGSTGTPTGASIAFWPETMTNTYRDPCAHKATTPEPAQTIQGLSTAVAHVPGTELVSGPNGVMVGGFPGMHVVIRIPDTLPCDPKEFYLWYSGDPLHNWRYAVAPGTRFDVWIIDHSGALIWIDNETYRGATPDWLARNRAIIQAIQFE